MSFPRGRGLLIPLSSLQGETSQQQCGSVQVSGHHPHGNEKSKQEKSSGTARPGGDDGRSARVFDFCCNLCEARNSEVTQRPTTRGDKSLSGGLRGGPPLLSLVASRSPIPRSGSQWPILSLIIMCNESTRRSSSPVFCPES